MYEYIDERRIISTQILIKTKPKPITSSFLVYCIIYFTYDEHFDNFTDRKRTYLKSWSLDAVNLSLIFMRSSREYSTTIFRRIFVHRRLRNEQFFFNENKLFWGGKILIRAGEDESLKINFLWPNRFNRNTHTLTDLTEIHIHGQI
jgi:hypothetical protein